MRIAVLAIAAMTIGLTTPAQAADGADRIDLGDEPLKHAFTIAMAACELLEDDDHRVADECQKTVMLVECFLHLTVQTGDYTIRDFEAELWDAGVMLAIPVHAVSAGAGGLVVIEGSFQSHGMGCE